MNKDEIKQERTADEIDEIELIADEYDEDDIVLDADIPDDSESEDISVLPADEESDDYSDENADTNEAYNPLGEAEYSDYDDDDFAEDDNDTVAMVSRNKERVQSEKTTETIRFETIEKVSAASENDTKPIPTAAAAQDSISNVKLGKICIVSTVISMITLCAVVAGISASYGYIRSLENQLALSRNSISELKEQGNELSEKIDGIEIQKEEYVEAMASANDAELYKPALYGIDSASAEKGKVLLYDKDVGYVWAPIVFGLTMNSYEQKKMSFDEKGRMQYIADGEKKSRCGIDVSSHQHNIDWQAVSGDGVDFAFLRIGFRGYGEEGNMKPDDKFEQNYKGAKDAGLDVGVYFFSQATSADEAAEEADYLLKLLDGRALDYPVVFDWENVVPDNPNDIPRTDYVSGMTLTECAVAFCEKIKSAGYKPMLYTNKMTAYLKYDMAKVKDYPLWLALYDTELTYCYDFDIWQYGTTTVDGIDGDVDVNIEFIK